MHCLRFNENKKCEFYKMTAPIIDRIMLKVKVCIVVQLVSAILICIHITVAHLHSCQSNMELVVTKR